MLRFNFSKTHLDIERRLLNTTYANIELDLSEVMKTDSSFSNDISRGGKIQSHRTGFTAGLRRSRYGSYEKYRASGGMLCRIQPREHQRESWCVSKNRMFSESTAIGSSPIVDYSSTDGSVEAQEIVDGGNIEEKNTFSKASRPCRIVAWHARTLTPAASLESTTTLVPRFFFSTPSTQLLDRVGIDT